MIDGLILIDKPVGPTSMAVVRQVKRLLGVKKAGHAGTLDPLASGLLPVCLGSATKLNRFLLGGDKVYRATFKLGETTDTFDATGRVTDRRPPGGITPADIRRALSGFVGEITQIPPRYSALKHQGERLYRLARRGVEIVPPPRQVKIHRIELTGIDLPRVEIAVRCGSGTYIRSLVHDIGQRLGCGAHLTALRREGCADLSDRDAVTLAELQGMTVTERRERVLTSASVLALLGMLSRIGLTPSGKAAKVEGDAAGCQAEERDHQQVPDARERYRLSRSTGGAVD